MPEVNGQSAFQERVNIILDELSLGIQWERPSLIMVVYRSEHTKNQVQAKLAEALEASGHIVLHYQVDRSHYDIPRELLDHPKHEQAVYFISGLRWGGGRGYSNTYRALNMHREFLIDGHIKAVFWLTGTEARQIPRFSPDFWAFRHKVVEFPDLPSMQNFRILGTQDNPIRDLYIHKENDLQIQIAEAERLHALGCTDEAVMIFRKALRKYPDEKAICLQIAEIHLAMGQIPAARRSLKKAAEGKSDKVHFLKEYYLLNQAVKSTRSTPGGILEAAQQI